MKMQRWPSSCQVREREMIGGGPRVRSWKTRVRHDADWAVEYFCTLSQTPGGQCLGNLFVLSGEYNGKVCCACMQTDKVLGWSAPGRAARRSAALRRVWCPLGLAAPIPSWESASNWLNIARAPLPHGSHSVFGDPISAEKHSVDTLKTLVLESIRTLYSATRPPHYSESIEFVE